MHALKLENVSKQYRLGQVGTGTLSHDLNRLIARVMGREDPYSRIGAINDREQTGGDYVWALRDINFEVEQGEIIGIIGRNGAGKSTLLKLLSRVTAPTTGQIMINGRVASLLEVGTGFHPELTGRENIYLNGAILGMTRREITRRLEEIVEFSGCAKYIDTPVKRYSSGMHVRLAFAVAAHLESDILIVDEVLAVGDTEFQAKCVGKMQDVSRKGGRAVLFVSHNMASITALCQRSIVASQGRIVFDGTSQAAANYYLTESRELIASGLQNRRDRYGNSRLRFVEFWIEDKAGQRVQALCSGDEFTLCFAVEVAEPLRRVYFAIAIYTSIGVKITDLWSDFVSSRFNLVSGRTQFRCHIDSLPLNAGLYRIDLYSRSNDEVLDAVEAASELRVYAGDYFGHGVLPRPDTGLVLMPHAWTAVKQP